MDRSAAAAWLTEIAKSANRPIHLISFAFDAATVYVTDAYRAIAYGGNTYVAQGHLLGFDGLEESAQLIIPQVRVTLSGADQTWIANVANNAYIDRALQIYKGFIGTGEVLIDPTQLFDGFMEDAVTEEDPDNGESTVVITASRYGSDTQRRPGRHTNDSDQQALFAGDTFFKRVTNINRDIVWGASGPK